MEHIIRASDASSDIERTNRGQAGAAARRNNHVPGLTLFAMTLTNAPGSRKCERLNKAIESTSII